jgi:hypothetical protein
MALMTKMLGTSMWLPLSASKIGGKIKPETQSHQLGPFNFLWL